MKILLAIILGAFFGYALYKVGATSPKKILSMLRLENLHLAKSYIICYRFIKCSFIFSKFSWNI